MIGFQGILNKMPESNFTFTDTADLAYRKTVERNVAGVQLSQRLWNLSNENIRNINDVVQESVRIGRSLTSAGKELLKVGPENIFQKTPGGKDILTRQGGEAMLNTQVPKYVRELADAAARARELSDSSILQQTIRKYQTYINNLTRAGEPEYQHLGIRGASRMLVKRLNSQNEEVYSQAVDKWVARKAGYQARTVARNEINEAHWAALKDEGKDKPYITGYRWELGAHPKRDICFLAKEYNVFTSKGWIPILKIKEGNLVLTHKGRFRKVIKPIRSRDANFEMVRITYLFPYDNRSRALKLEATANHPILVNREWKAIGDIKVGDHVSILSSRCKKCNKQIPYYRDYCSKSCASKIITEKQWSNPKHRENLSRKRKKLISANGGKMPWLREYLESGRNIHNFLRPDVREKNSKRTRIQAQELIKQGKHPFQNPDTQKKANRILATKKYSSYIEKKIEWLLKELGYEFVHGYYFKRNAFRENGQQKFYVIDFILPKYKIAIECYGWYWHQDKEADKSRQREIEESGFTVLRFTDDQIRHNLSECANEIKRITSNHDGLYEFMDVKVERVDKWIELRKRTKYNLEVEEDNSFIIKGFVVHNCDELASQNLFGLGPGIYPKDQVPTFGGNSRPHVNCNCSLSQIVDENYFEKWQPSPELLQQVREDPRFPEFKAWATGWLSKLEAG